MGKMEGRGFETGCWVVAMVEMEFVFGRDPVGFG